MLVAAVVAAPACHVRDHDQRTTPIATERVLHAEGAIARRPAIVWSDAGELRFVEPLECPSEELVRQRTTIETVIRPNLATFTVGVIAAAIGGAMATTGLFSSDRGANPLTYVGVAGLAVGLPLAIGPWLGNRTETHLREPGPPVRRLGPSQPCGDRPLAAHSATLEVSGLQIHGAIDREGRFEISPYQWIDAYDAGAVPAAELTGTIDGDAGARTIAAVLDSKAIAAHAATYLAQQGADAAEAALRLVPGIVPGPLHASLVTTGEEAALRVVLALRNDGPGDASGVRGQITAPATPAIDGRMIYVGRLARGAAVSRELVIPLAASAATALRGQPIELSIELRDAHGTAPTTPVKLRTTLRGDPVR